MLPVIVLKPSVFISLPLGVCNFCRRFPLFLLIRILTVADVKVTGILRIPKSTVEVKSPFIEYELGYPNLFTHLPLRITAN